MGLLSRLFGRSAPDPEPQQPPAPRTTEDRARERHEGIQEMLAEQAASDPRRAREIASASVDGVHYLELVEPIKQAKREGRNEDALALCYQAIQGAENDRPQLDDYSEEYQAAVRKGVIDPVTEGWVPAPAYTEHAAIILRKLKRPDEEAVVLERYLALVPEDRRAGHKFTERLAKVRELQQRAQG